MCLFIFLLLLFLFVFFSLLSSCSCYVFIHCLIFSLAIPIIRLYHLLQPLLHDLLILPIVDFVFPPLFNYFFGPGVGIFEFFFFGVFVAFCCLVWSFQGHMKRVIVMEFLSSSLSYPSSSPADFPTSYFPALFYSSLSFSSCSTKTNS